MILLYLILTGIIAGFLGSIVGIGGGIIIVPVLSLFFKIPIQNAIGASLVAVMATSISASRLFLRKNTVNISLGLKLEIFTTAGAIAGGILISYMKTEILFGLFGALTFLLAYFTLRKNLFSKKNQIKNKQFQIVANNIEENERSYAYYYDGALKKNIGYNIVKLPIGFTTSFFAGIMSGLLGVGGGFIKVPTMNLLMNVPLKVATATSNFMIGITAVASAVIYLSRGLIDPFIAMPVVLGVLAGGTLGSFTAYKVRNKAIVIILVFLFILFGINMILKSFGINLY